METKSASSTSSSSSSSSSSSKLITNGSASIKHNPDSSSFSASPSSFTKTQSGNRTTAKASNAMVPPVQTFPPVVNGAASHSPKASQTLAAQPLSAHSSSSAPPEESELYIPPSSNSLIQLARLSSSLKIPSPTTSERHKRSSKSMDPSKFALGHPGTPSGGASVRPQKRARRQSFGRNNNSKPLDFSSHFSSHSSPPLSTSSSVSPSSLRSTPSHNTPPPAQPPVNPTSSFEFMKNLAAISMPPDSVTNATTNFSSDLFEAFLNVGSFLGASPEGLRELLISIAQSISERRAVESSNLLLEQQRLQQHQQSKSSLPSAAISDPSTQCLYCGHICADMSSLVQHIYTHLASLHKQQTEAPPSLPPPPPPPPPPPQPAPIIPPMTGSPFDLAAFYAKLLQKAPESPQSTPPSMVSTDPNSLFLAWLNVFRPAYAEGLASGANR